MLFSVCACEEFLKEYTYNIHTVGKGANGEHSINLLKTDDPWGDSLWKR